MGLPALAQTLIKKVASLKDKALSTILTRRSSAWAVGRTSSCPRRGVVCQTE